MSARALTRLALTGALSLVLTGVMTFGNDGGVAAAPGDGFAKPDPQAGVILENHVVNLAVSFTTCTDVQSEECHLGAYDLTLNYADPIFDVVTDGGIGTSGTSTSITMATANWKLDQWKGSQVHITSGPGFNQKRTIVSNSATTINVDAPWNPPPAGQPGASSVFVLGGMVDAGHLDSTGRPINCQSADYTSTSARLVCISLGDEPEGPTGWGKMTNLTVRAVGRGFSSLTLTDVQVLEVDGDIIPKDVFNGNRRVILCPDPNNDGRVNAIDLGQIAQQFGKTTGQTGYTQSRDPSEDGVINALDLGLTAQVFGLRCVQL